MGMILVDNAFLEVAFTFAPSPILPRRMNETIRRHDQLKLSGIAEHPETRLLLHSRRLRWVVNTLPRRPRWLIKPPMEEEEEQDQHSSILRRDRLLHDSPFQHSALPWVHHRRINLDQLQLGTSLSLLQVDNP